MATAAFLPAARQLRCLSTTSGKTHSIQGPAVRALLRHYGINQTAIKASGPKNNIIKTDVLKYIHAGNLKPIMPYHTTPTQRYPPRASNQQTATAAPTVASGAPQLVSKPRPPRRIFTFVLLWMGIFRLLISESLIFVLPIGPIVALWSWQYL